MISVPDTTLEGFYVIQTYKLGAAFRASGVPIVDQQGPFKADCAGQFNGTARYSSLSSSHAPIATVLDSLTARYGALPSLAATPPWQLCWTV
jgi:hypothetical protein